MTDLLKKYGLQLEDFKRLDWRLQKADNSTIIFYSLSETFEAENKLHKLLETVNLGLLLLNRLPTQKPSVAYVVIASEDWTPLQKEICDYFFPFPDGVKLIGVTGTNGKTTTTDLVLQIGGLLGKKCFSIGTLGVRGHDGTIEEFGMTTPGFIQLRKIFYDYGKNKDFVVMEVTSHALDQKRVFGLRFDACAWMNFTQDHLDYHKTMEDYFHAKEKIFEYLRPGVFVHVPSSQDELLKKLSHHLNIKRISLDKIKNAIVPEAFKAIFNQENLSVALSLIEELYGLFPISQLEKITPPPGRFYVKRSNDRIAVVDSAHTPDALDNICSAVKKTYPDYKLIVLFGCGGDRDRSKRPIMAEVVCRYADEVYLTSDNPRTESPLSIIRDIIPGMGQSIPYKVIEDRTEAMHLALKSLGPKTVLLAAGKGHENYIIVGQTKYPYSDIALVEECLGITK